MAETENMPYYGIYFFTGPVLMLKDVELVRQILIKDFDHFTDRNSTSMVNRFVNESSSRSDKIWMTQMTNTGGEMWKNLRSTFSPIFTSGKMRAMLIFMQETNRKLMNALDGFAKSGESFEVKECLGKYSMDTIASCAFGVDAQSFEDSNSKFVQYAANIFKRSKADALKILLALIPGGSRFLRFFNVSITKETETEFFYEVIMSSLKQRRESKHRRNDLIDLMMDAIKGDIKHDELGNQDQFEKDAKLDHVPKKGEFDEMVIVATAIVLMVAGYDTTGTTMAWVCYELAKNPEVQNRLREEVQEIMQDSSGDLTYEDLNKMTYLDQVISETLRFHSPVAILNRTCNKNYKIPGTELVIEEGVKVWSNVMAIHFNPEHYPNPLEFDPEHFSKEAKAKRSPYAYLPFGQGPRNCIGMRFALIEAKLGLANIVRNFNLIPSEKTQDPLVYDPVAAINYVKNGLFLKAEKI